MEGGKTKKDLNDALYEILKKIPLDEKAAEGYGRYGKPGNKSEDQGKRKRQSRLGPSYIRITVFIGRMFSISEECAMHDILCRSIEKIRNGEVTEYKLLRFLEDYYDGYVLSVEKAQENEEYPEELTKDLQKRPSGVLNALQILEEMEVDFNEGDGHNPLMMAVAYADAAMTEYLIRHGANASYWIDMEEEEIWYYDDLDIQLLNDVWPKTDAFIQAVLNTAKVLVTVGNLGNYSGFCFSVDTQKREIEYHDLHVAF